MNEIKEKKFYDVKVETLIPAVLTYRVYLEKPHQAVEEIKRQSPRKIEYKFMKKKDSKITVYNSGTSIIEFIQNVFK